MRRLLLLLAAVAACCVAAAVAGAGRAPLGSGPAVVWVLRPHGPIRSVVVFVHGWGDFAPFGKPWIAHLRATGNAVVYPRYQLGLGDAAAATIPHLRAGLASAFALRSLRLKPVVAVGYSWGATIVMYYATFARAWHVPAPSAVMSVFPASIGYGGPPSGARLPSSISVLLVGGDVNDPSGADAIWRWLRPHPRRKKSYVVVRSTPTWRATHDAAARIDPIARRVFWRRLDRLVAGVRR